MYLGLIVEYSRMQVPSLSSGCEIAPFFARHADHALEKGFENPHFMGLLSWYLDRRTPLTRLMRRRPSTNTIIRLLSWYFYRRIVIDSSLIRHWFVKRFDDESDVAIRKTLRSRVSDSMPNGSPKSPVHYVSVHAHLSHGQAMISSCHQRLSSSCDSKLSSTDTSACYHHESHNVIMRLVSLTVSMTDASSCETAGMHGACHCTPLKLQTR